MVWTILLPKMSRVGNRDCNPAVYLQLGLTLITNNEREFSRIPNLTIENWTH